MHQLSLPLIQQAVSFLEGKIRRTPLEYSPVLSDRMKVPIYFKLEFLQTTGSFKIRGGLFYLSTLTSLETKKGVAACSAGNHGLGVAYAAQKLGIPCTIYVPSSVDVAKYEKIKKLGAEVIKSPFSGYDDTYDWALKQVAKTEQHLISAFDDVRIMASNGGSLAHEVLTDLPEARNFLIPVGGGGLSAGFAYYVKEKNPQARIIGCQHQDSPALHLSLQKGQAMTRLPAVETLAGAIEGGIGEKCFGILKDRVSDVALVSEEELIEGVRWMLENHQYLIEPSSAVVIASCLFSRIKKLEGPTVIVLSGRNVNYGTLQQIITRKKE
ncbi:MAG: pyridoxal-phosphate dependent enzyme [Verrucomicrobia bacterium]|nr:pyridoxal-phosphate dependent enzyme [Verrucomicrobiota bacterium]